MPDVSFAVTRAIAFPLYAGTQVPALLEFLLVTLCLQFEEVGVLTVLRQQALVSTPFHNFTVVDYDNLVRGTNR